MLGVLRQAPQRAPDPRNGRIHASRQQRADQHARLGFPDFTGIGGGVDGRADAVFGQLGAVALLIDPRHDVGRFCHNALAEWIVRADGVKDHRAIVHQLARIRLLDADRPRENAGGEGFSDGGNGLDLTLRQNLVNQPLRILNKVLLQLSHHRRRQRAHDHAAVVGVLGRINLQHNRRWAPGCFELEIRHTNPARRQEPRVVVEDFPRFLIAATDQNLVARDVRQTALGPQFGKERNGIGQDRFVVGINIPHLDALGRSD